MIVKIPFRYCHGFIISKEKPRTDPRLSFLGFPYGEAVERSETDEVVTLFHLDFNTPVFLRFIADETRRERKL